MIENDRSSLEPARDGLVAGQWRARLRTFVRRDSCCAGVPPTGPSTHSTCMQGAAAPSAAPRCIKVSSCAPCGLARPPCGSSLGGTVPMQSRMAAWRRACRSMRRPACRLAAPIQAHNVILWGQVFIMLQHRPAPAHSAQLVSRQQWALGAMSKAKRVVGQCVFRSLLGTVTATPARHGQRCHN